MSGDPAVVGRTHELAAVDALLAASSVGPSGLVLAGPPGIGKTVLWEVAVARARARGHSVLTHRGVQAEAALAFAGLSDIVAPVLDEVTDVLPAPRRRALEVALLLADPEDRPPDARAIGFAVLDVLDALAHRGPVLVALDDLQWLDGSSAATLPVALRRLRTQRVGVLATVREAPGSRAAFPLQQALDGHDVRHLTVPPLGRGDLHRLLRERLGGSLPLPELQRIERASDGNPYFALALGATADRRSAGLPPAVPDGLRALLGSGLQRLAGETLTVLLDVAALAQPTVDALSSAHGPVALDAVHEAVREGVLAIEGARVRFTHPLLASLCYEEVLPSERRAAHRRLAGVVGDPEERARHLALGAEGPDEAVAGALDRAVAHAEVRGATSAAADLALLAVERTSPDAGAALHRRQDAARLCRFAGDFQRACSMYEALLDDLPAGPDRARVLYAIASLARTSLRERVRLAEQALVEAGVDTACRAQVLGFLGHSRWLLGRVSEAVRDSRAGLALAEADGDPRLLATALGRTACVETFALDDTPGLLERAMSCNRSLDGPVAWHENPTFMTTVALMHGRDELDLARQMLREVESVAGDRGDEDTRPWVTLQSIVLEWHAGHWREALHHAVDAQQLARHNRQVHYDVMVARFTTPVLAGLGLVEECRSTAEEGTSLATSVDDERMLIGTVAALGHLELALGDVEQADRLLHDLPERLLRTGHRNPFNGPWADAVETAIARGDLDRAGTLLDTYRDLARRGNGWARIGAARCTGLLATARGDLSGAVQVLERALASEAAAVYPFERGRTLLALGAACRRDRRTRAAREALEAALAVFRALDASLWIAQARGELRRISGRRPVDGRLTEIESRVAALAAAGHRNREIAGALFLSVGTVEAYLTRVYRTLGIRSRTELARRIGPTAVDGGHETAIP